MRNLWNQDKGVFISGYSKYNPIIGQNTKKNLLKKMGFLFPPLPDKKFDIIYADPPWDYAGKTQYDKTIIKDQNPQYKKNIFLSSSSFKYPTLKLSELLQINVSGIAEENSLLFMWSTNPHLDQAIQLGKRWGFEYKTVAFVWNKMKHNPGQYTLSYCELCLLFKRGKIPQPRGKRNVKQLIHSPRNEHSLKPDDARKGIESMFPTQKRIELFARKNVYGWENWGLDIFMGSIENMFDTSKVAK